MAVQIFRTDSSFSVWDLKGRGNSGHGIALSGFLGEVLKTYIKKPLEMNKNSSPTEFLKNHVYDPLGIVNQKIKDEVIQKLKDKLWSYTKLGYDYEDIPDLYYALVRLPQWLGAAKLVDSYGVQSVSILNSSSLSQLAMNLPAEERRMELVHYELIKRLSPKLLNIPFAMQGWHKGLKKYGASPEIFNDPVTPRINIPSAGSWQFLMNENPLFRVQVINLIENNKSLGIWDHVNVNKLLELLKNKTFAHFELISLYGLLTVFFRDLGFVVPSKLGNYNSKKNQIVLIESKESSKLYTLENTKLLDNDTATDLEKKSSVSVSEECLNILFKKETTLGKNESMASGLNFRGCLEVKNNMGISGWAFCEEFPMAKLSLSILINKKLAYQITANLFRGDLKKNGIGDGSHAFRFSFDPPFDGDIETVKVQISGSKKNLTEIN